MELSHVQNCDHAMNGIHTEKMQIMQAKLHTAMKKREDSIIRASGFPLPLQVVASSRSSSSFSGGATTSLRDVLSDNGPDEIKRHETLEGVVYKRVRTTYTSSSQIYPPVSYAIVIPRSSSPSSSNRDCITTATTTPNTTTTGGLERPVTHNTHPGSFHATAVISALPASPELRYMVKDVVFAVHLAVRPPPPPPPTHAVPTIIPLDFSLSDVYTLGGYCFLLDTTCVIIFPQFSQYPSCGGRARETRPSLISYFNCKVGDNDVYTTTGGRTGSRNLLCFDSGKPLSNVDLYPADGTSLTVACIFQNSALLCARDETTKVLLNESVNCYFTPPTVQTPALLFDCIVKKVVVRYDKLNEGDEFYQATATSFENVCGRVNVHSMYPVFPHVELLRKKGLLCSMEIRQTSFGQCSELLTVYGNVTLRKERDGCGTVISFKGVRCVFVYVFTCTLFVDCIPLLARMVACLAIMTTCPRTLTHTHTHTHPQESLGHIPNTV